MSQSLQKEIETLISETLKELGGVSHSVPGVRPLSVGFSQEPISSAAQDIYNTNLINSYKNLKKSLKKIAIVIDELESRGHSAGDIVLVKDQIEQTMQMFQQKLLPDMYHNE